MSQMTPHTLDRLRAANPARVRPDHGLDPVAQAALSRIMADAGTTGTLSRPRGRIRSPRRLVLVLAVMALGAGGAVAATDPLGWWSANPSEARYGTNPALRVRTPSAQEVRCRRSASGRDFRCTAQRQVCAATATGGGCTLTGSGLAYSKLDAIHPPIGSSFSRASFLSRIARAVATGAMSTIEASKFRADLSRVPDGFFTELRLASRFGTYAGGSSNARGQTLVPPPSEPNFLVCENAGHELSCQDLNGDLHAPIGAGVYSASVGPGWRAAPRQRQDTGLPPGIHFTSAEAQVLIDMLRAATVQSASSSSS